MPNTRAWDQLAKKRASTNCLGENFITAADGVQILAAHDLSLIACPDLMKFGRNRDISNMCVSGHTRRGCGRIVKATGISNRRSGIGGFQYATSKSIPGLTFVGCCHRSANTGCVRSRSRSARGGRTSPRLRQRPQGLPQLGRSREPAMGRVPFGEPSAVSRIFEVEQERAIPILEVAPQSSTRGLNSAINEQSVPHIRTERAQL